MTRINNTIVVLPPRNGSSPSDEPEPEAEAGDAVIYIDAANLHLPSVTGHAWLAIEAANQPRQYFQRGGIFVDLTRDEGNRVGAEAVSEKRLRHVLARVAFWYRVDPKAATGSDNKRAALPPRHVCEDMLARRDPPLPRLRGLLEAPVFLEDGRLLVHNGYDAESGYFMELHGLDGVRDSMSLDESRWWLLEELLGEFPFVDEASRAHALGALIMPFVRPLIEGPTPLHLFEAPGQGTGKGLLADLIATVATGHEAPVMSLSRGEDEIEKRITSLLVKGSRLILLDNVRELASSQLEAALTCNIWTGRILGFSRMATPPNAAVWMATGNNPRMSREMLRRTVSCRIDAEMEHPEDRTDFRHELPMWAAQHRPELVSACLSLARAWWDAGRAPGRRTLGRFESWAAVVGGIVAYAEVPGFLADRERLRRRSDLETTEWTLFCKAWWDTYGEAPKTAGNLLDVAVKHEVLLALRAGRSQLSAQQRLGHALADRRDNYFGLFAIRSAGKDSDTGSLAYCLQRRAGDAAKTPETQETPAKSVAASSYDAHDRGFTAGVSSVLAGKTTVPKPRSDAPSELADSAAPGFTGVSGVSSATLRATPCRVCRGTDRRPNPDGELVCSRCHP